MTSRAISARAHPAPPPRRAVAGPLRVLFPLSCLPAPPRVALSSPWRIAGYASSDMLVAAPHPHGPPPARNGRAPPVA